MDPYIIYGGGVLNLTSVTSLVTWFVARDGNTVVFREHLNRKYKGVSFEITIGGLGFYHAS